MKKRLTVFGLLTLLVTSVFLPVASGQFLAETQWGLPDGAIARLGRGSVGEVAYSPDGSQLAVVSSIGIWLYDAETGEPLDLLTGHTSFILSIAFSPDGSTLASGSMRTIRLWDVNTGDTLKTLTGHTAPVLSVAFSGDGRTLATGSRDRTIRLWDVNTGETLKTLTGHTDWVRSIAFSPDGSTLASGSWDGAVLLWDLRPPTAPAAAEDINGDGL